MEEQRMDLTVFSEKIQELKNQIAQVIVGRTKPLTLCWLAFWQMVTCWWGRAGVAKDLAGWLISKLVDARFSRVQFTPTWCRAMWWAPPCLIWRHPISISMKDLYLPTWYLLTRLTVHRQRLRQHCSRWWRNGRSLSTEPLTRWGRFIPFLPQNPVEQEGTFVEAQSTVSWWKYMDYPSGDEEEHSGTPPKIMHSW